MGLRSNSPWNSRSRLSAKSDFLANGMGGKTKISGSRSFCLCSPFFLDSVASRAARVAFSHPVVSCFACLILSVKCCTWSRLLILSWRGQFVPSCPDVTLLELSLAQSLGIDSAIPYIVRSRFLCRSRGSEKRFGLRNTSKISLCKSIINAIDNITTSKFYC
jgi:hypothetical protein